MGIFRIVISPYTLSNFKKIPAHRFFRYQNKFCSKQMSTCFSPKIQLNASNNVQILLNTVINSHKSHNYFSSYKSSDPIKNKNSNKVKDVDTLENNKKDDNKSANKKTAKVLPIVLHQLTGHTDNSVAVPFKKEIPQWIETDSVAEATKTMEKFTDDFLKSQHLIKLEEVENKSKNKSENINENINENMIDNMNENKNENRHEVVRNENIDKYENLEENENEIDNNTNKFMDIIHGEYNEETNDNVISFRLDPKEFSHLPISSMNLKFDMEMPDLADVLEKTKDSKTNIIPLGFNAKIKGTVDLDDNKLDGNKLENLEFDQISHMVSSLAANICAVALQKVLVERNKDTNKNEKSDEKEPEF